MRNCIISGFCAGMIGGALGLGGAIILVPVWLNSGINQLKVVSTSPPLIFFSALISFTICFLSGRYRNFMELAFYFGLAYIGSAVVKSISSFLYRYCSNDSLKISSQDNDSYYASHNHGFFFGHPSAFPVAQVC